MMFQQPGFEMIYYGMQQLQTFCGAAQDVMAQHMTFLKWKESPLSTEQLKSSRWLLNVCRKNSAKAV